MDVSIIILIQSFYNITIRYIIKRIIQTLIRMTIGRTAMIISRLYVTE